jgi:uncharacterized protein
MNLPSDESFLDSIAETVYVVRPKDWDDHWHGEQVFSMAIVCILAHIAFLLAAFFGWMLLFPDAQYRLELLEENQVLLSAGLLLLSAAGLLGSVYFVGLRPLRVGWERVGLRRVSPLWLIFGLLLGALYIPINLLISTSVLSLFEVDMTEEMLSSPLTVSADTPLLTAAVMIMLAGLVVPFAEEVFFRGVLLDWLSWRYGGWVGIVVSSVVFGVLHVNPGSIVSISILGLLCAIAAYKTGSVWTAVAIHAGNNIVAVLLPLLLES